MEKNNNLLGISYDELKEVLNNYETDKYRIEADSISSIILIDKKSNKLIRLECIKKYYDLTLDGKSRDKIPCKNLKEHFKERTDCSNGTARCAKCHLACINDYLNGKVKKI